ncbi:MAG TPA: cytochrome c biogenesis protein CcsA, partial [Bacillota bacterium]
MLLGMIGEGIVAATFVALAAATVLLGAGLAFKPARATQVLKAGVLTLRFGFVLATAAVVLLEFALLTDRFELVYVARNSWTAMAWPYKIGALWSGQAGSLLLWLWLLALYAALLSWRSRPAEDQGQGLLLPALAVLAGQATFFALLVTFVENPFAVQLPAPADGRGMNPLLQNPSMLAHPLLVYGGFVGMAVPFAFAVAALWRRRVDAAWLRRTRRWTLVAWILLSAGMLVGAQWSYIELGWGGYWGWDPVENASLLPWLTATAFLHSAWVQERRGMLKTWNLGLIMATYALTILGTLITRSGVLASVHAFAQSPIGPWFVGYLGAILALSCYLLLDRHRQLRREPRFESYLSREVGFHLNNWLLLAITFAVLWGTLFPIISRFRGVDVTVGPPFYNRVAGPLLLGLIALMGIGPVLAWRKSSPAAITA